MTSYDVPLVLIIFNRPDTARRVFEMVCLMRPKILMVVADGPRTDRPGEAEKCAMVRSMIDEVDWPCEVVKNFSAVNMGCKLRLSSGLDWAFELVEEAVILEDDCLPNQTFFDFCAQMLSFYRTDDRIMHISGVNFQFGGTRGDGSYYFSRKAHVWGWATWRRAWKYYDVTMRHFPLYRDSDAIINIISNRKMQRFMLREFAMAYENKIDTWDYQWTFAMHLQNALSIIPNVNLVSNIGFGNNATHTTDARNLFSNMPVASLDNIIHPTFVVPDTTADEFTFKLENPSRIKQLFNKFKL
jgi:hypothetical protein